MSDEEIKTLFNIVDKLEKRIFLLEKVLASHAKCIGELRGENNEYTMPRSIVSYVRYNRQETWTKRKQEKYN